MPTPASFKRHPIHPMLVGIPIGLWVFAMVADLVHLFGWGSAVWKVVALYAIGGGIVAALIAAVPGFIDFASISDRRVAKVALTHMVVNLVVVGLFALSFWLRLISPLGGAPVAVSGVGIVLLGLGGWLGGELVFVHGIGVEAADRKASGRAAGRRIA
ncbi:MAG: DUF2231 domain-containing protein [Candidatus Rokuibacteriota bacterium]